MTTTMPAATMSATTEVTTASDWHTLVVWTQGSRLDVDRLLLDVLAPLADGAVATGAIKRWFFIRYSEGGEHLRLRLDGAGSALLAEWSAAVRAATGLTVTVGSYEPEVIRYGGPSQLAAAETVFCTSTQLALALLRRAETSSHRLAIATDLILATTRALDLDELTAAAWLRVNAYSWRWDPGFAADGRANVLNASAVQAAAERRAAVLQRWRQAGSAPWANVVRSWVTGGDLDRARLLGVWSSQLHMLLNRLGVSPDEERWLEWLVASCLERGEAGSHFFDDGPAAPDRAYLVNSRYCLANMGEQAPEDVSGTPLHLGWAPVTESIPLAACPTPPVSLWDALADRRSRRGPYGPLSAADLGTLLLQATRPGNTTRSRTRAYPSAGAQLPVRLRLVVRVAGSIPTGLYEVDLATSHLDRIAECPSPADLAASSMWFRDGAAGPEQIDVNGLPVLIGLYLDLAPIRARYGMRALRFALLEAGHVAQNLALVAAACGLQVCTVGGFYDDVANEVFLLDGVDRVMTYLLPVGGAPADTAIGSGNRNVTDAGSGPVGTQ